MKKEKTKRNKIAILIAILGLFFFGTVSGANYPLDIINVDEIGADNRIYFAYPGVEYKVRIAAHGGAYPFNWTLTDSSNCGMTITSDTGEITWGNPLLEDDGCLVEVQVVDAESNLDVESYTVTVTPSTDKFLWMDASNDNEGRDGSHANPYRNFDDWYVEGSGSDGGKIMYLRTGVYDFSGISGNNNRGHGDYQLLFNGQYHPIAYIAYPDESPIFDGTRGFDTPSSGKSWIWGPGNNDMYYYGITFENLFSHAFDIAGSSHSVWHDCIFQNMRDVDSYYENDGYIFWRNAGDNIKNAVLGCTFQDTTGYGSALKCYDSYYLVIEGNSFLNIADTAINWKDSVHYNVARNNVFEANGVGVGINGYNTGALNNEIAFNLFKDSNGVSVYLYNSGTIGATYIYRNTIEGSFWARSLASSDGIITINNNVIMNDENYGTTTPQVRENIGEHYSISAEVCSVYDNLMGDSSLNFVDDDGYLTEAYSSYLGTHGWQVGDAVTCSNYNNQTECEANGCNYCEGTCQTESCPVTIRADVNQDSQINTTDAQLTLRNSLGLDMTSTNWQTSSTTGDVNCDLTSNSTDAMLLLRYSLGLDMSGTGWCE